MFRNSESNIHSVTLSSSSDVILGLSEKIVKSKMGDHNGGIKDVV